MTRILIQCMIAAALAAGSGSTAIFPPRSGDLAASVPFNFMAGDKTMQAGDYVIRTHRNGVVEICEDGVYCATVEGTPAAPDHDDAQPSLAFRHAGDQRVFVGVVRQGQSTDGVDTESVDAVTARKLCIHRDTGLPMSWH